MSAAITMTAVVDIVAVAGIVAFAVVFLGSRFIERRRPGASTGAVVVGAGLQKGLDKARRRRARR